MIPFLENLEIRKFYGIGKVTQQKMYSLGIFTGKDLKSKSEDFLALHFKKMGKEYFRIVRGIHNSPVIQDRIRKSIGAEHTFTENLTSEIYLLQKLEKISEVLEKRLLDAKIAGKTVTLKIKYSDFKLQTRSKTLTYFISTTDVIFEHAKELLFQEGLQNSVRLVGISISNLNSNIKKDVAPEDVTVQLKFEF